MKHHVCAVLFFVNSFLCADFDKHTIAEKSKRIGRFNHEDSFDENLVEEILKNSPAAVKKNIQNLLYPSSDEAEIAQRLLLLGGTSNASTTAIAKSIALRCGYDYYVIEASALLKEYREGRQMLLNEVRPIIKQGKPIALIITELPEMADYSGLLASTLWMLIDQSAQYPDVMVIATSAFQKGQLSEEVQDRFGADIISVSLDKYTQDQIEKKAVQKNWFERNKRTCAVACLALATIHVIVQTFFAIEQAKILKQQYITQLQNLIAQINIYENIRPLYSYQLDGVLDGVAKRIIPETARNQQERERDERNQIIDGFRESAQAKLRELTDTSKD